MNHGPKSAGEILNLIALRGTGNISTVILQTGEQVSLYYGGSRSYGEFRLKVGGKDGENFPVWKLDRATLLSLKRPV